MILIFVRELNIFFFIIVIGLIIYLINYKVIQLLILIIFFKVGIIIFIITIISITFIHTNYLFLELKKNSFFIN